MTMKYINEVKYFKNNKDKILGYSQSNILSLIEQNKKYYNAIIGAMSKQWQMKAAFLAVSNQVIFNEIFAASGYKLELPFDVLFNNEESIYKNIDNILPAIFKYCGYKKWFTMTKKVSKFKANNKLTKTIYERIKEWNAFRLRAEFCFKYLGFLYRAYNDNGYMKRLPVDKTIFDLVKNERFHIITHIMHPPAQLPHLLDELNNKLLEYDEMILKNKELIEFLKKFNNFKLSEHVGVLYFVGGTTNG